MVTCRPAACREYYPDDLEESGFFKNMVALARTIELPREVVDAFRATQWDALQACVVLRKRLHWGRMWLSC